MQGAMKIDTEVTEEERDEKRRGHLLQSGPLDLLHNSVCVEDSTVTSTDDGPVLQSHMT